MMNYESYVLKCMDCGEIRYVNKQNNVLKIFDIGCTKCGNNKWQLLGEGNCNELKIHTLHKKKETNDQIEIDIRKKG